MKVLIACEFSGTVRDAFARRGHNAWSCDLLPTEKPGQHIQGDVLNVLGEGWDLMVAHPPCTRLTNSGVRWLHVPPPGRTVDEMWAELQAAAAFYCALRAAPIPRKAIENPIMHKYARRLIVPKKRQVVQPHFFGDRAFKATGLELYGLPELRRTHFLSLPKPGTPEHKTWSVIHRASPGKDRWELRSRTFPGMANAFAEQWGSPDYEAAAIEQLPLFAEMEVAA